VKLLTEVTHKSPAYEAYRMLWTNIEFARQDAKLRTLLVTSGGVGEGKTTSLVNLAIVAAREGNRVLVIDSDFRRPRVHKLLGITNHVGLTDVLLRNVDPGRVAVETAIPDLWVLPSGKLPPNAMGLLNSRNMRECIEYLYDKYDIILFDSPPVIGVSDASVLAGLVDRIVLVVEYRKYPKSVATRAKKILENVGGKILGGVINNLNIIKEDYYYYSQVYHYFQASGDKAEDDEAEEGDEAGEGREAADGDTDADGPDKTDE
jgi:succinoglycan biosynthesis transport protein ExoP